MSLLRFLLPDDLASAALKELRHTCGTGGQERMPMLTQLAFQGRELHVSRDDEESGGVDVPWVVEPVGTLMTSTATLIEKPVAYPLVLELARGKVNQLRNQAAEWRALAMPPALALSIREATKAFAKATVCAPSVESTWLAQAALQRAFAASEQLVNAYVDQVFQFRQTRQPRLDTLLGCRLATAIPAEPVSNAFRDAFNTICLPLGINEVAPTERDLRWTPHDHLLDWAVTNGFHVMGGPLIDFNGPALPGWVRLREKHVAAIASCMCDYVDLVLNRYRGRIRTWLLTAASNCADVLGLNETEMLWLTSRIAETARHCDPGAELIIGVSQPWGEYLAGQPRSQSPLAFADLLVRSGLRLAAIDLELVMGVRPRGSYCRDLLDASRLIDFYAGLDVPLHVTLGLPSDWSADAKASQQFAVDAGCWRSGFTPEVQAEWAHAFARLALCKPSVHAVNWVHWSDAEPHVFPSCGLLDARGSVKPAVARLAKLRQAHVR